MKKFKFYKEIVKSVTSFNVCQKRGLEKAPHTPINVIYSLAQYSRLVYLSYAELRGVPLNAVERHCRYPYNEHNFKTVKERLESMYQIYNDIEDNFEGSQIEELQKVVQTIFFDQLYMTSYSYHNLEICFEKFGRKISIKLGNNLLIKQHKEKLEIVLEIKAQHFLMHKVLYLLPTSLTDKNQIIKTLNESFSKHIISLEVL